MNKELVLWEKQWVTILSEFQQQISPKKGQILVVGCSTSEVVGEKIGSAGSMDVADLIYRGLERFSKETGIHLAFQCCEHLNRALVVERTDLERLFLEEVSAVPVPKAGGSMAAYAYRKFNEPVLAENIKADYGIDIGDTFIGMHLKPVVVPVRASLNRLGDAHVTLAKTRPKLIGGARAVYSLEETR